MKDKHCPVIPMKDTHQNILSTSADSSGLFDDDMFFTPLTRILPHNNGDNLFGENDEDIISITKPRYKPR